MKTRVIAAFLLILLCLTACANQEIRPGVYVTEDVASLPLPTEGYRLYIVGEAHGNRETKLLFITYLKRLHAKAGIRDVILEEDQAYENIANAFVSGESDSLIPELCLRTDVLTLIREFNAAQPEGEKIKVHLVDVDSPMSTVHLHLQSLREQIGAPAEAIQIPELTEFETWNRGEMYKLIRELEAAAVEQPAALNGLETAHDSLRWYFLGNRIETGEAVGYRSLFAPIREDVITRNVQFLLESLGDKPLLAFYGSAHGMKMQADPNPPREGFTSWAQRIFESGVPVYSLDFLPLSGEYFWRGNLFPYGDDIESSRLPDGTSLGELLIEQDKSILYVDFRVEENAASTLPAGYADIPAGQVYDGEVIFREATPMEDACK
jgi:hypothetical protein